MKFLIMAVAAAALATPALAAPGGNGGGHGNAGAHMGGNGGAQMGGASDRAGGAWSGNANAATNPGGHVMPHGLPPGQVRKMNRASGGLVVGSTLSSSYPGYRTITRASRYNLPAAPAGYEYVRVGDDAYLRQTTTGVISKVISNLFH